MLVVLPNGMVRPVGFGWTIFLKVRTKFQFYEKEVIIKSGSLIFGLVRLIILSYKIEKVYEEVQNYRLPMHVLCTCKAFCCAKGKQ